MKSLALRRTLPLVAALALLLPAAAGAAEHRVGGGIHYWRTLDDLEDEGFGDIQDDGTAYVASWQILPAGIFRFELGLEYFPDDFGGAFDDEVLSPQAYLLVGHGLYVGVGAGLLYSDQFGREPGSDDDDFSDPFYALRGGFEMTLIPRVHFDVNANYRANAWEKLGDVDVGTLTLGAQVRIGFGRDR
ncbi:MAG TPA: hypothetical protein VF121_15280 [Thermoanaerobaculia bacterium]|nr:hypothetical protein [Thermoanaerobaculia bacterium]